MSIDYLTDFDAYVIAALAHPCFIDSRGNLYVLRDDGATVIVAGPDTEIAVQFQGVGSSQQIAWAATQERLLVCFNEGAQHVQALLPRSRSSGYLPEYRRSFFTAVSPSTAYFVHNTPEALYCFAVSTAGASLIAKVDGHNGRGIYLEGENLYVFGMRSRIHKTGRYRFSKGEWFSLTYGIGTILRIDLSSGRVHIDSATDTKKELVAAWKADAGQSDNRYVKPLLEAWLDCVETAQGLVLIGGIMDERPSEFDDAFEEPQPSDFCGVALYRWHIGQEAKLLRLLPDVRYIGRMAEPDGDLFYFVKQEDPHDVFKDRHFAMRVSRDMQSPLIELTFDWAKENLWTVKFEPCYAVRLGAIAAVTTKLRDTPLPYRRHLAMSENGFNWRFIHPLPDSRV